MFWNYMQFPQLKLRTIKHPLKGVALGYLIKLTKIVNNDWGKEFFRFTHLRFSVILTRRSFFVVSARIIGG